MYPQIPLVFSGVNDLQLLENNDLSNITGVFEYKHLEKNLLLLQALQLDFETVLIVGDNGESDREVVQQLPQLQLSYQDIALKHIAAKKLSNLIKLINQQTSAPIFISSIGKLTDDDGNILPLKTILHTLAATNRLIIATEDSYLLAQDNQLLGGYMTTASSQGKAAAQLAALAFGQGSATGVEPIRNGSSELILDWNVLEKFHLSVPSSLLDNAKILNRPKSYFIENPQVLIWLVLSLTAVIALGFTFSLSMNKRKNRIIKKQITDSLTGLGNRTGLGYFVKNHSNIVVAVVDINDFNALSHFYGGETCDKLLKKIAQSLASFLQPEISLYRVNHDQFILVAKNEDETNCLYELVPDVITHLERYNFIINGISIGLSCTAGISSPNAEVPMVEANTALVHAKRQNLQVITYEKIDNIVELQQKNIHWAQKVRRALNEDRIRPFYQVIIDNKTGKVTKAEALVRLINVDGSVSSPLYFLEAAKQSHQYEDLTKAVITHSLKEVAAKGLTVTINFTIEDTQSLAILDFFKAQLAQYQCADNVIIEIVESEAVESYHETANFISKVQQLGCKVAIDDFGTGYSSFMHVISLNADILKIDGSIIQKLIDDPKAEILVRTIVNFAKQLKMETVAEFVDSQAILDKVIEIGVDFSQGFFIAKPELSLNTDLTIDLNVDIALIDK
jgi:EAL domain-containing protein (putative c-di-GMP-specific phosphodiesterase class I)/GGDEF domain-containing protein